MSRQLWGLDVPEPVVQATKSASPCPGESSPLRVERPIVTTLPEPTGRITVISPDSAAALTVVYPEAELVPAELLGEHTSDIR